MSTGPSRPGLVALLVVGAVLLLGGAFAVLNRRDQIAKRNEEIQYDDFGFSVVDWRRTQTLGSGASERHAHGSFLVLSFRVANHAKRVSYRFPREIVRLVDGDRREYRIAPEAQAVLDASPGADPCAGPIPHGAACTTELVFEIPEDARQLDVRLSFVNGLTDLLDLVFCGFKRIRLDGS